SSASGRERSSSSVDLAYALAAERDGKLVVVGGSNSGGRHACALARYTVHGRLDRRFGTAGRVLANGLKWTGDGVRRPGGRQDRGRSGSQLRRPPEPRVWTCAVHGPWSPGSEFRTGRQGRDTLRVTAPRLAGRGARDPTQRQDRRSRLVEPRRRVVPLRARPLHLTREARRKLRARRPGVDELWPPGGRAGRAPDPAGRAARRRR